MPTWLGGKGDPYSMVEVAPKVIGATVEMQAFYIIQFGKHLSRFYAHCYIRP